MAQARALVRTMLAVGVVFVATSCGVSFPPLLQGSIAGRPGLYDYAPSVIQTGDVQQIWWCGQAYNPHHYTQFVDTIVYQSINLATSVQDGPFAVLGETANSWDSLLVCNPKVVRGSFANPLGNGKTYTYAMYYVALGSDPGTNNKIGVAFSNDGIAWKKYPQPILSSVSSDGYGAAQPAVYNSDHHSAIRMFYEDSNPTTRHIEAVSSDGVHFTQVGILTTRGLDPNYPPANWGDMAYDTQTGYWYAGFNKPLRDPSTTEGYVERGQYGFELYRIPDSSLLTGDTPWELLTTVDTCLTGFEANFIPGFARDQFGSLNVGLYPAIEMFMSISNPPPRWNASPGFDAASGGVQYWDIGTATWTPGHPLKTLNRYFNNRSHEVTTGWIDSGAGFTLQSTLGHLYESPQQGATLGLYSCKNGSKDYFVSRDSACEGLLIVGTLGYAYPAPVAGLSQVALYRCNLAADDFVSLDPGCEGQASGQLLGYALP